MVKLGAICSTTMNHQGDTDDENNVLSLWIFIFYSHHIASVFNQSAQDINAK